MYLDVSQQAFIHMSSSMHPVLPLHLPTILGSPWLPVIPGTVGFHSNSITLVSQPDYPIMSSFKNMNQTTLFLP